MSTCSNLSFLFEPTPPWKWFKSYSNVFELKKGDPIIFYIYQGFALNTYKTSVTTNIADKKNLTNNRKEKF